MVTLLAVGVVGAFSSASITAGHAVGLMLPKVLSSELSTWKAGVAAVSKMSCLMLSPSLMLNHF
jgi:hypothetical protein